MEEKLKRSNYKSVLRLLCRCGISLLRWAKRNIGLLFLIEIGVILTLRLPAQYLVFVATLTGVALHHHEKFWWSMGGLAAMICVTFFPAVGHGAIVHSGKEGVYHFLGHKGPELVNLGLLLIGFDILGGHFSDSHLPRIVPRYLKDDWRGGFQLQKYGFALSGILDNIITAIVMGKTAKGVYAGRVSISFITSVVVMSNAGGAGSFIGDTPDLMAYLAGMAWYKFLPAYFGGCAVIYISGVISSIQQQAHHPIQKDSTLKVGINGGHLIIFGVVLGSAVALNFYIMFRHRELAESYPWMGGMVMIGLIFGSFFRKTHWKSGFLDAGKGALFLIGLIASANMVPLTGLPEPTWYSDFIAGLISAVFDNIPLTAVAIIQAKAGAQYVWGRFFFPVNVGGSLTPIGTSAGVALTNEDYFPQAGNMARWLKEGWHVSLSLVIGYPVVLLYYWKWWSAILAILVIRYIMLRIVAPRLEKHYGLSSSSAK